MKPRTESLLSGLEAEGFRWSLVPIGRLNDLQSEIENWRREVGFDPDLERDYLSVFSFSPPDDFADAKSILEVAAPVPQIDVAFHRKGKPLLLRIPPTYLHDSDAAVERLIFESINPAGYRIVRARLPEKLLAVRSGLAKYGRNNIAYVQGMGSFHRPIAFFSDLPCERDSWHEETTLKRCKDCLICWKACPTGAIPNDRFLIRADRCITFLNERPGEFPEWLDPAAHHCVVGCMRCQRACPENRGVADWVEARGSFTEEETELLLGGAAVGNHLQAETRKKLEDLGLAEYSAFLDRNLRVLLHD